MLTHNILGFVAGYGFAVVVSPRLIQATTGFLHARLGLGLPSMSRYIPEIVGIVERFLYVSAFLVDEPTFVIAWLALKVAGQWGRWTEKENGRNVFSIFLIGSGLSVAYGFAGAEIVNQMAGEAFEKAASIAIAVVGSHLLLLFYIGFLAGRRSNPPAA